MYDEWKDFHWIGTKIISVKSEETVSVYIREINVKIVCSSGSLTERIEIIFPLQYDCVDAFFKRYTLINVCRCRSVCRCESMSCSDVTNRSRNWSESSFIRTFSKITCSRKI